MAICAFLEHWNLLEKVFGALRQAPDTAPPCRPP